MYSHPKKKLELYYPSLQLMKKFTFLCSILAKTHWHHPYFLLLDFVFLQIKMWSLIRIKTRKPRALNKPVPQWKKKYFDYLLRSVKIILRNCSTYQSFVTKKQMFRVVRNLGSAFNFQKKKRFIFKDGYQQPWFLETRGKYAILTGNSGPAINFEINNLFIDL